MADYSKNLGRLDSSPSRSAGKKIETWTFRNFQAPHRGAHAKGPDANAVDVYLVGTTLKAQGPALPPGDWTDTDLARLHARVEAVLIEQATLQEALTWTPYLEVQTHLASPLFRGPGRELTISYRELLRGTRPDRPEEAWTLNGNAVIVPFPTPKTPLDVQEDIFADRPNTAEGLSAALGRRDVRNDGDTYAYVPDTPVTRAALDRLCQAMDELGAQLHALLSPSQAEAAMARISQAQVGGVLGLGHDHA